MSWSLQLQNGDFPLSGGSFAMVINEQKLVQDMRCAVLEPMGTDDMHPDYGSLIDGGVTPDDIVMPSLIGNADIRTAAASIQAEIQRLATSYQAQQLTRAKNDRIVYGRASLTPGEVLAGIANLGVVQNADALTVSVALRNGQNIDLGLDLPFSA